MKKFNNKILIIALLALAGIFVLSKIFRSPSLSSNMDTEIFRIDTAKIVEVRIKPSADSLSEIKLVKNKNQWVVTQQDIKATAQQSQLKNLLDAIAQLKPERIVTRKKEKWNTYHVGDSSTTTIFFSDGTKDLLNLKVGKESNSGTYVRPNDEDEVYTISGSFKWHVDRKLNDWRDQSFLRLQKDLITKINFQYPADSSFVLEKKNNIWMIGNEKADSTKVENYLTQFTAKNHAEFEDQFKSQNTPELTVTFTTSANTSTVVKAWKNLTDQWILNSSVQPETNFLDASGSLVNEIYIRKKELLP
jgi:hypothetical protein